MFCGHKPMIGSAAATSAATSTEVLRARATRSKRAAPQLRRVVVARTRLQLLQRSTPTRRSCACAASPRERTDAEMLSLWDEMEEVDMLAQDLKQQRQQKAHAVDESPKQGRAADGRRRVRRVGGGQGGTGSRTRVRGSKREAHSDISERGQEGYARRAERGSASTGRRDQSSGERRGSSNRRRDAYDDEQQEETPRRPPLSSQILTFEPTGQARRQMEREEEAEYYDRLDERFEYDRSGERYDNDRRDERYDSSYGRREERYNYDERNDGYNSYQPPRGRPSYDARDGRPNMDTREPGRRVREGSRRIPDGSPIRRSFSEQLKSFMEDDIDNSRARDEVEFYAKGNFSRLGLSPDALGALAEFLGHDRPSQIQSKAIPLLLKGSSTLVADQTGSGKTLAYLVPLLERLRKQEKSMLEGKFAKVKDHAEQMKILASLREPCKPRALIMSPTQELSAQVLKVARELSKGGLGCRSFAITGNSGWKTQAKTLEQGVDLVIGTPGRLLQHVLEGTLKVDNLKMVVMDECDVLLDDELKFDDPAVSELRKRLPKDIQEVFVTATLPFEFGDWLNRKMPDLKKALGPGLHRTAPGLRELMIDCGGGGKLTEELIVERKLDALIELVNQEDEIGDSIMSDKTIIFCNKIQRCQSVENALKRNDRRGRLYKVLPYHSSIRPNIAEDNLKQFMRPSLTKQVLVCTDRASRGIDSYQVDHVILFDWPRDPNEYIRRVGRTARAGSSGTVTALVAGSQVRQAKRVMAANRRGLPIHRLPAGAKGPKGVHKKGMNMKYASRRVNARANGRRRAQKPNQ